MNYVPLDNIKFTVLRYLPLTSTVTLVRGHSRLLEITL